VFDNAIFGASGEIVSTSNIKFAGNNGESDIVYGGKISNRYLDYKFSIPRIAGSKFGNRIKGKSSIC